MMEGSLKPSLALITRVTTSPRVLLFTSICCSHLGNKYMRMDSDIFFTQPRIYDNKFTSAWVVPAA